MRRILEIFVITGCLWGCGKKAQHTTPSPVPEAPIASNPPLTDPSPLPTPSPSPSPVQVLHELKIQTPDNFFVGQVIELKAVALYVDPAEEKIVDPIWSLPLNEAKASIDADGRLVATEAGKVQVQAQFADKTVTTELLLDFAKLAIQEEQFWVYRQQGTKLLFNNPWDAEAGHEIRFSAEGVPDYGLNCLAQAKERVAAVQNTLGRLVAAGGTSQLIYLVNVVPIENKRDDLRRLDRDAYFWHWNRIESRPSLAFSKFREGAWVWEVIATSGKCLQPDDKDVLRFVDYAVKRLGGYAHAL